jgi:hypothetical protein
MLLEFGLEKELLGLEFMVLFCYCGDLVVSHVLELVEDFL